MIPTSNKELEKKLDEIFASTSGRSVKVKMKFGKPIYVYGLTKRVKKEKTPTSYRIENNLKDTYTAYLFRNDGNDNTYITPRINSRKGYPMYLYIDDLVSIEKVETNKKDWNEINRQFILNNTEEGAWTHLTEELKTEEDSGFILANNKGGPIKKVYMKSKFPKWVCEKIEEAFKNKTEFRYSISARGHQGRDISMSTQMGKDGVFRAWYSSEYPRTGNGDYFLLINPRVAIFCETD